MGTTVAVLVAAASVVEALEVVSSALVVGSATSTLVSGVAVIAAAVVGATVCNYDQHQHHQLSHRKLTTVTVSWTVTVTGAQLSLEPELAEPEYGGLCHLWRALIGTQRGAVPRMVAAAASRRHTWRKAE